MINRHLFRFGKQWTVQQSYRTSTTAGGGGGSLTAWVVFWVVCVAWGVHALKSFQFLERSSRQSGERKDFRLPCREAVLPREDREDTRGLRRCRCSRGEERGREEAEAEAEVEVEVEVEAEVEVEELLGAGLIYSEGQGRGEEQGERGEG